MIMKKFVLFTFLMLGCFSLVSLAQREKPPTEAELAEITARGRELYAYDVAAWHSTDAVLVMKPIPGTITGYVTVKTGNVWVVSYGKFNDDKSKFLIAFEATQQQTPTAFKVEKFDKPKEDSAYILLAAKAMETSKTDFGRITRPYNVAVLPAKDQQFFVYLVPAQTENGVFPLGGDVRYLISKDGAKIVEKRQLHKTIIEFRSPSGEDEKPVSGYHTAILDNIPEDTDVFHVLTRKPSIPELVVTQKFVYQIAADGFIKYVMPTEAFLKIGKAAQDKNKP